MAWPACLTAAIYQRPRTGDSHREHRIYPYLLRDLVSTRRSQLWCADVTYPRAGASLRSGVRGAGWPQTRGCPCNQGSSGSSFRFQRSAPGGARPRSMVADRTRQVLLRHKVVAMACLQHDLAKCRSELADNSIGQLYASL